MSSVGIIRKEVIKERRQSGREPQPTHRRGRVADFLSGPCASPQAHLGLLVQKQLVEEGAHPSAAVGSPLGSSQRAQGVLEWVKPSLCETRVM